MTLEVERVETIGEPEAPVIRTMHGAVRGSVADGINRFLGTPMRYTNLVR